MLTWVNFFHLYQPPWQQESVTRRVTAESYEWLVSMLKKYPHFHATVNIAGTLLDTLNTLGFVRLISDLRALLDRKQIELTGSSQFHAFLPQLPPREIERQIILHEQTLYKYFRYKPSGFFTPEMAYSHPIGSIIQKRRYAWIILDPMSYKDTPAPETKYLDRRTGLAVVFRSRRLSKSYPPEEIYRMFKRDSATNRTVITATDGELYGHFHKDWQAHLERILRTPGITTQKVSDYIATLSAIVPIRLRQASWETRSHQIHTNNPFAIWFNRSNPIHRRLWKLASLAIDAVAKHGHDPNFTWARQHLDRGLASCSWWWASEVKTSPFAPIAWSPDEIEKGALELIKAIRSLHTLPAEEKIQAERVYAYLIEHIWTRHWHMYEKS